MTSNLWSRVAPIVDAALRHDDHTRAAFVAEACGHDASLVREVESLLAHASGTADFLSTPAQGMARWMLGERPSTASPTPEGTGEAPSDGPRFAIGQQVGIYRIERLLGRGGMGEVYEAEHLEHGRRVALKVLATSLSKAIDLARFLQEGQLAAAVNHPHVVYIYGSEEISGMPAIAMELLPGGTLKDRVEKEGPLVPREAVDAMLQVVAGLQAAHVAGILHLDIKPSNCFVDTDGTVKVGDFGLAIPALEHVQLTARGTIRATPAFASPEQLRGKPLDVRSDIYAVGATLYYLLTGRSPFGHGDAHALVSRIATERPISPRSLRREVPRALDAVVMQCLATDPAHRPETYRVLATLLESLGSGLRTPAPLGMRTAAYAFDTFFAILLPLNIVLGTVLMLPRPSSVFGAKPLLATLLAVSYFTITEGLWGASIGKWLCGFRVVPENGGPPRFARAFLRALVFVLPAWLASGLVVSIAGLAYSMQGRSALTATVVEIVVQALMFVTVRRANDGAGLHEWASRTRTVATSAVRGQRSFHSALAPVDVPVGPRSAGPYQIVDAASSQPNDGAALGRDDRLRRTVWLRFPGADASPIPYVRRILRRPARPRWLAGQRGSGLSWDAYERVPGQPFMFMTRACPWEIVRGWLCALAEEVHAGLGDGSLPVLTLDRVWIGTDGRAWLLDWPAPGGRADVVSSPTPEQTVDLRQGQRFLYRLAVSALEGQSVEDTRSPFPIPRARLPIPASDCLAKLRECRFATSEDMLAALVSASRGPAAIARTKRAVHLSLCAIPTTAMLVIGLLSVYNERPAIGKAPPEIRSVSSDEADRAGVAPEEVVVAVAGLPPAATGQLRGAIGHLPEQPITPSYPRERQRPMVRVRSTRKAKQNALEMPIANETPEMSHGATWRYLWSQTIAGLAFAATLGLLSALVARGGSGLHMMRIAMVTRNGTRAAGSRARVRAVLSWSPVLAVCAAAFAGHSPLLTLDPRAASFAVISPMGLPIFVPHDPSLPLVRLAVISAGLAVFAAAVIYAVVRPERGIQDRLAGTWLVPR